MTPTGQYPRSRYVAMQVVLFVILLGAVALADWVSHRHVAATGNKGPIVLGDFTLHLPADWEATEKRGAKAIEITAAEPGETGRKISALFQQLSGPVAPVDYLLHAGLISGSWNGQQMTVYGHPGAYIEMMRVVDQGAQRVVVKDILACIMLPNGQVLTLQLTGPGRVDENDEQMMREFLTRLEIKPQKNPPPAPALPQAPPKWEGI